MSTGAEFNELIHAPVRLRICGLLRTVSELEFSVIRDTLGVTDATVSKNLRALADEGIVELTKEASPGRDDARRLTWVKLTAHGRDTLARHLAALARIAEGAMR